MKKLNVKWMQSKISWHVTFHTSKSAVVSSLQCNLLQKLSELEQNADEFKNEILMCNA